MYYKIGICDDSPTDQGYVMGLVEQWAANADRQVQMDRFPSAESFLFHYAEHKDYDILLLDIEMGGMDGVALAKKLRQENLTVQIVFITGFPDFIAEGYEVSALHYLMKPVKADTLTRVLDKAAANLGKVERSVIFHIDGEAARIAASEIEFIESFAHSCCVHTTQAAFEVKLGISEIEKLLGDGFVRAHRSYLVGLHAIRRISKADITLDGGKVIPLSRGNYQAVNEAFIRHFKGD